MLKSNLRPLVKFNSFYQEGPCWSGFVHNVPGASGFYTVHMQLRGGDHSQRKLVGTEMAKGLEPALHKAGMVIVGQALVGTSYVVSRSQQHSEGTFYVPIAPPLTSRAAITDLLADLALAAGGRPRALSALAWELGEIPAVAQAAKTRHFGQTQYLQKMLTLGKSRFLALLDRDVAAGAIAAPTLLAELHTEMSAHEYVLARQVIKGSDHFSRVLVLDNCAFFYRGKHKTLDEDLLAATVNSLVKRGWLEGVVRHSSPILTGANGANYVWSGQRGPKARRLIAAPALLPGY